MDFNCVGKMRQRLTRWIVLSFLVNSFVNCDTVEETTTTEKSQDSELTLELVQLVSSSI